MAVSGWGGERPPEKWEECMNNKNAFLYTSQHTFRLKHPDTDSIIQCMCTLKGHDKQDIEDTWKSTIGLWQEPECMTIKLNGFSAASLNH